VKFVFSTPQILTDAPCVMIQGAGGRGAGYGAQRRKGAEVLGG
jgi:hypothetical protein